MNCMRSLWLVVLVMCATTILAEDARTFSADGGETAAQAFGPCGGWLVQSPQRWDLIQATLKQLGVKNDDKLGTLDFARENLLCIFHYGDEADRFSVHKVEGDEKAVNVNVVMSYIIYKSHLPTPPVWRLFVVPVPKSRSTAVTVAAYHPMNNGPYPTPDKAQPQWKWTFSPDTGEAVAGLTAHIEPKAATVKPGEDILLKVKLMADEAALPDGDRFALSPNTPVRVWDNKYSNGYRNDAYEVVLPDGKVAIMQKPVIDQWDKNVPHPIEIKPGAPYELVNWAEGANLKSLKERGLDASKPGKYSITCLYQQSAKPPLWSGSVRSNTVVVEVR